MLIILHGFTDRRTGRAGNHGYAYTFMTPDQGKYAVDIIKALELSIAPVPKELTDLWEEFKKQAEAVCIAIMLKFAGIISIKCRS